MLLKVATTIFLYLVFLSTTIKSATVYNNARFDPIDTRFTLRPQFSVTSIDDCLCECLNDIICFTATYFDINQTCSLFFARFVQGTLRVVPTIINASVYFFDNKTSGIVLKFFNHTNETIYAIWNTTAGSNSSPAVSGISMGSYWPTEPPEAAFDNNLTTDYTSYGNCNYSYALITCGKNTGLYLTLNSGPLILVAFYFVTNKGFPLRDPRTTTIEGSNMDESALTLGSSWTLIYNGSTGLMNDPGRSNMGTIQIIPNFQMRFASYRLLVTSKRGDDTSVSYGEFLMIGY